LYTSLQAHYQAHKITLAGVDDSAFTRSLTSARVQMNPHQVDAALFALKSPLSKGVLLADEVGLGKPSRPVWCYHSAGRSIGGE
jgi:hypothetical protein